MLYRYVGFVECRVWYALQSLNILSITVTFGFYLGLYLKGKSNCEWNEYDKNQVLILVILGGVLLLPAIVVWIIIVYIIFQRNKH